MKNVCSIIFIVLIQSFTYVFSQEKDALSAEKLSMNLNYHLGFITIPTGEIEFKAYNTFYKNKPGYCLEAQGGSLKKYESFYKYTSSNRAYIDPSNNQLTYFERKVNQNDELFEEYYTFDGVQKKINSKIATSKKAIKHDTLSLQSNLFDFLSAGHHLRFIDYDNMKIGEKVPINVLLENTLYPLYIKYMGMEKIVLPMEKSYFCYKIAVQTIEGSVFKGGESMLAWVSADNQRLPIQFEAKILVGSVKAYLCKAERSEKFKDLSELKK